MADQTRCSRSAVLRARMGSALVLLLVPLLSVGAASAQLVPERVYYGIDRPMPIEVVRPAGVAGDLQIKLLEPVSAGELASVRCEEGMVDLASLMPQLFEPTFAERAVYAQLVVGDTPVGPALVVQPLRSVEYARLDPRGQIDWLSDRPVLSGFRVYQDQLVLMETSLGDVTFRMRPDEAPNTVWNFLTLADGGFYTDILFHRIIGGSPEVPPFVVQVGDPTGGGSGGPGYFIDLERSELPHTFGVLSMARFKENPNSNGSQVFICLSRERTRPLDGDYTTFGEAVDGGDTILALESVPTGAGDRPVDPPVLERLRLIPAPPYGTGPKPIERPKRAAPSSER
ncbi:MAG: peptidylprolyl isomerase [Planctomycetota bacterium]